MNGNDLFLSPFSGVQVGWIFHSDYAPGVHENQVSVSLEDPKPVKPVVPKTYYPRAVPMMTSCEDNDNFFAELPSVVANKIELRERSEQFNAMKVPNTCASSGRIAEIKQRAQKKMRKQLSDCRAKQKKVKEPVDFEEFNVF